jgi:hypothetical protein
VAAVFVAAFLREHFLHAAFFLVELKVQELVVRKGEVRFEAQSGSYEEAVEFFLGVVPVRHRPDFLENLSLILKVRKFQRKNVALEKRLFFGVHLRRRELLRKLQLRLKVHDRPVKRDLVYYP